MAASWREGWWPWIFFCEALDHTVLMVAINPARKPPDKYETKVVICWDTTDILPTSTGDFFQQYFIALSFIFPL